MGTGVRAESWIARGSASNPLEEKVRSGRAYVDQMPLRREIVGDRVHFPRTLLTVAFSRGIVVDHGGRGKTKLHEEDLSASNAQRGG